MLLLKSLPAITSTIIITVFYFFKLKFRLIILFTIFLSPLFFHNQFLVLLNNTLQGGVTLIRAAGKNYERVAVVCDPSDYGRLADVICMLIIIIIILFSSYYSYGDFNFY